MSSTLRLVLEDGTVLTGESFGSRTATAGEVVFNTGMVGYPESLTDPSYRGQIMVLTYPLVGNYGIAEPGQDKFGLPGKFESERIQASGLIVSEYAREYSHHTATRSLHEWLASEGIPAIAGIDTRALTRRLRDKGSMLGKIETDVDSPAFYDPNTSDLGAQVSVKEVTRYQAPGDDSETYPTIIVLDCGCKSNIIRSLLRRKMNVVRVPYDYYFLNMDFDGLVISNGPGDPKMYSATVRNVKHALAVGKPILGICLGIQLLARAVGAETYKLKFGHRSHNQPCVEHPIDGRHAGEKGTRCYITSQNHGFVVRRDGLPEDWRVWFTNANDNTVEGIRHISKPFMAVQFHPEASPGPVDTAWIFDDFGRQVNQWKR
jgi:carbamoyl-phosphate synthase small subunit